MSNEIPDPIVPRPQPGAPTLHMIWAFVPGQPPEMLFTKFSREAADAMVTALTRHAALSNTAVEYRVISSGFL